MAKNYRMLLGSYNGINAQMNLGLVVRETQKYKIYSDLQQLSFMGNEDQSADYLKAWSSDTTNYSSGNITAKNFTADLIPNSHIVEFAYLDDTRQRCGLSIRYDPNNPANWCLTIIKNPHKPKNDACEVLVFAPDAILSQGNATQDFEAIFNFLGAKNIEPIVKSLFTIDGEINTSIADVFNQEARKYILAARRLGPEDNSHIVTAFAEFNESPSDAATLQKRIQVLDEIADEKAVEAFQKQHEAHQKQLEENQRQDAAYAKEIAARKAQREQLESKMAEDIAWMQEQTAKLTRQDSVKESVARQDSAKEAAAQQDCETLLTICENYLIRLEKANPTADTQSKISTLSIALDVLREPENKPENYSYVQQLQEFKDKFYGSEQEPGIKLGLEKRRDSWLDKFLLLVYKVLGYEGEELSKKVSNKSHNLGEHGLFKIKGREVTEEIEKIVSKKYE